MFSSTLLFDNMRKFMELPEDLEQTKINMEERFEILFDKFLDEVFGYESMMPKDIWCDEVLSK